MDEIVAQVNAAPPSDSESGAELLLRAPTTEAVRLLEADGALVYLLAEDRNVLRFAAQASEVRLAQDHPLRTIRLRVGLGLYGKAVANRTVEVTGDYLADPHFEHTDQTDAFARETGLRSFVVTPLVVGDEVFGALGVYDRRPDAFGLQQIALVRALGDHAALQIANARLIAELDEARLVTRRQADVERALRELGTRISAERDPRSVVGSVVEEAARLAGGDGGRVDILDNGGASLVAVYASDHAFVPGHRWHEGADDSVEVGVSGRAVLSRRAASTADYLADPSFVHRPGPDAFVRSMGIHSVMAVPLFGDDGPFGALTVWSRRPDAFNADAATLLETIAGQAAVALVRSRLIEELGRSREALVRRADEERALRDLARRAMSSLDPESVLDDVAAEAARLLGPVGAVIELLRPSRRDGGQGRSAGLDEATLEGWRAEAGAEAAEVAVRERRTVVGEGSGAVRSWAVAPLLVEEDAFGTLAVLSPLPGAYGPDETGLLGSLADHAALALAGAVLVARVEESETRYRSLVESLPDLVFTCEAEGNFTFMSESVEDVLGWSPQEIVGRNFREMLVEHVDGSPLGLRFGWMADNPGRTLVTRLELLTKGGTSKPIEVAAAGVLRDGVLDGVHGSARDVSEQERLERELRESEARYRFLVQSSPDLVWVTDADGRLTYVSDRAKPVVGWDTTELIGRTLPELAVPLELEDWIARFDWLRQYPGVPHRNKFRIRTQEDSERLIEITGIGMLNAEGEFIGAHGTVRDIGELERLEGDLRRQTAELAASEERAHLARELHDSVTQSLFSMTLQSRSIELLMARDPSQVPGKLVELRELQRDALAEMRALIFELRPGHLQEQGLAAALRTHASGLSARIGLPIVVDADLGDRRPSLDVEEALYRIGQEALHNVVKHAGARQVRVEVDRLGNGVRVRVADDGQGFDPQTVPDGHLGLAGMRARAERLGGRFSVVSGIGRGTVVEAVIPEEATRDSVPGAGTTGMSGAAGRR
ncbi:MAG: GAF domain-containing protein [Candidatus Limnocylindrales bacterium]